MRPIELTNHEAVVFDDIIMTAEENIVGENGYFSLRPEDIARDADDFYKIQDAFETFRCYGFVEAFSAGDGVCQIDYQPAELEKLRPNIVVVNDSRNGKQTPRRTSAAVSRLFYTPDQAADEIRKIEAMASLRNWSRRKTAAYKANVTRRIREGAAA